MDVPPHTDARSVKRYYVAGEFYDWVTDPRALERIFHWGRATVAKRLIRRLGRSRFALDIGCGTGLITRYIRSSRIVGIDINRWNVERQRDVFRMPTLCNATLSTCRSEMVLRIL